MGTYGPADQLAILSAVGTYTLVVVVMFHKLMGVNHTLLKWSKISLHDGDGEWVLPGHPFFSLASAILPIFAWRGIGRVVLTDTDWCTPLSVRWN